MTVFLIPNLKKENAVPTALRAAKTLRGAGARVLLSDAVREYFVGMGQEFAEDAKAFELCDVIVTVGGDGTILHAARQSLGYNKPLLGINIGRMGFLATVEAYEMEKLERLVHGEYILDRRSILSVSVVYLKHGFRNAMRPVLVILCFRLPMLIGGSVVIESVFGWPGIGSIITQSVVSGDYPVIMVTTLLVAAAMLAASFLVDVITAALDPRVRLDK